MSDPFIKPLLDHALKFQATLEAWAEYFDRPDFDDVVAAADVLCSRLHDLYELEEEEQPPAPPRVPRTPVHLPAE